MRTSEQASERANKNAPFFLSSPRFVFALYSIHSRCRCCASLAPSSPRSCRLLPRLLSCTSRRRRLASTLSICLYRRGRRVLHERPQPDAAPAADAAVGGDALVEEAVVGVDAAVGGDAHRSRGNVERRQPRHRHQRARRGDREARAAADGVHAVGRLQQLALAGHLQAGRGVGDDHDRLEVAQHAVLAPQLGQLHGGAPQLPGVLLEPLLEPLEERQPVGGRACKAAERGRRLRGEAAQLARVGLDDLGAGADLAVRHQHDLAAVAHAQHRRAVVVGAVGAALLLLLPRGGGGGKLRRPQRCRYRRRRRRRRRRCCVLLLLELAAARRSPPQRHGGVLQGVAQAVVVVVV